MAARGFYHDGVLALQEAANGRRVAEFLATEARHSEFSESDVAQIEKASFFFIASSYGDQPDCSFKEAILDLSRSSARRRSSFPITTATSCIGRSAT